MIGPLHNSCCRCDSSDFVAIAAFAISQPHPLPPPALNRQHPFLATASPTAADKLAQRAAASAEGRREITSRDDEDEGNGSVVHRKPAAATALDVRRSDSTSEAVADADDEGYSTVIFRNPPSTSAPLSVLDADGDAAYGTVIVRQPAAAVAGAPAPNRPASLEIPVSPNSTVSHSTFSASPASSPTSVLVSFAPETTQPFGSPLSSDSPTASPQSEEAPLPSSSSPHVAHASDPPPCEHSSEDHAAASYAVAFAHNRRKNFIASKSRSLSDPVGGVVVDPFSAASRKRSSLSGTQQQGVSLGR